MGINVNFSGDLGGDPEMRYSAAGKEWCTFSVSVRQRDGETTWMSCKSFGKAASLISTHFSTGSFIVVNSGSLEVKKSEDGTRTFFNVSVNDFSFGPKTESSSQTSNPTPRRDPLAFPAAAGPDDLPF